MTTDSNPTQIEKPSTAPVASAKSEVAEAERQLADLAEGGAVDVILKKRSQRWRDETVQKLKQRLIDDLKVMSEAARSPKYRLSRYHEIPRQHLPEWLVTTQNDDYNPNAVLRYCLASRWQIKDNDEKVRSASLALYQKCPEDYDEILDDLIPAEFREEGWRRAAELRFDSGAHDTAKQDWSVYRRRLETRRNRPLIGIPTGLPGLDARIRGLRGLTFLGGGPGVGKTSLALFMAVQGLLKQPNLGVLFYSLDMPKSALYDRLLCQEAGIEYGDLVSSTDIAKYRSQIEEADSRLKTNILPRLRIAEHLGESESESVYGTLHDDVNSFLRATGTSEVLTVIDYFQLIPVPDGISNALDADFHRVRTLQRFQEWTRDNDLPGGFPVLVVSEVRKGESGRTEISIGDLMGSARLGYAAETVLLMELPNEHVGGDAIPVRLKIAKGRDGSVRSNIDLLFEHTRSRFREAPKAKADKKGGKTAIGTAAKKANDTEIDPFAGKE